MVGEKLANLENHELFAKIFLVIIHRYTENVFGIFTHCNLFANSSPILLTCMVHQNFPLPKFSRVRYLYLYLNTFKSTCILLNYFSQNNAVYLYLYFNKCQSTCTLLKYFHMYFAPCLVRNFCKFCGWDRFVKFKFSKIYLTNMLEYGSMQT